MHFLLPFSRAHNSCALVEVDHQVWTMKTLRKDPANRITGKIATINKSKNFKFGAPCTLGKGCVISD